MELVDYRAIAPSAGGFSDLFFDYLANAPSTRPYFGHHFSSADGFEKTMHAVSAAPRDRTALVAILEEQNRMFGAGGKTFENITLLRNPQTCAVVTGQQVGLCGGPMYTVFKALTAVRLAEQLTSRNPGRKFVPVFWVEGEDHDFAEMHHTTLLGADFSPVRLEYLPGGVMPERNIGAVGEHVFDASLASTMDAVAATLQTTEFTPRILEMLRACYAPGKTFNQAFVSWMIGLCDKFGLVFLSPNHPGIKKILSPLFVREIAEYPKFSQLVITRSAELEQHYHAQVKPKSVNLFMFHRGGRYLIEPRENDFSLKGTRHFISRDEMMRIATDTPELLSANVVLRPLAQDLLLPTVAYVAGPSEIAYHAQFGPLYEEIGIPRPVVYPRVSASFIAGRLISTLDKYQLTIADMFGDISKVTAAAVEHVAEVKLDALFGEATRRLSELMTELRFGLKEVDPTLLGALETTHAKSETGIGALKEKAVAAQKRSHDTAVRQIEKAHAALFPNGMLQERELPLLYFLNRYGPDLVQWLHDEIDIETFSHQMFSP